MRRGFTLIEMALVLSICTILLPGVYVFLRMMEGQHHAALAKVDAAGAARTVSESLRLDLRTHRWAATGVAMEGAAPCGTIEYAIEDGVLARRVPAECGATLALARYVQSIERTPSAVVVAFRRQTGPGAAAVDRFVLAVPSTGGIPLDSARDRP